MWVIIRIAWASILALLFYLVVWGIVYRVPCSSAEELDLRSSGLYAPQYYIVFCASLASNSHGFPGHAFIAWCDNGRPDEFDAMETTGYCPRFSKDQIPSLYTDVPGIMVCRKAGAGSCRNVDKLIVCVDKPAFEESRRLSQEWSCSKFRVGEVDCVAFANAVAKSIHLNTPCSDRKYPQDYIRELKACNRFGR